MNEEQRELIALLMKGYTLNDIAELRQQEWRQIERSFRNAVSSIVRENNRCWEKKLCECLAKPPMSADVSYGGKRDFHKNTFVVDPPRKSIAGRM